jgi:transcriptional regulator with XRE-family HTH domain
MHIGRKIKKFRDENKLSQKEFAEKIGVTQGFLSYVENGRLNIESPSLEKKILTAIGEKTESENKVENPMKETTINDNVHSPKHYMIPGCNFESRHLADAIVEGMPNPLCTRIWNVVKYLVRAEKKNGKEDYEKAVEYLTWTLKGNEITQHLTRNRIDSIADKLKTDWTTIILGICEGLPSNKALLLNEAFRNLITLDIQKTIDCITKIIELG